MYCLSYTLIFFSCKEYQQIQADITVTIPNNKEHLELQDVFTVFSVIELENNEKCMLGKVEKMQCTDSMFYIFDRKAMPSLFAFHKDGKFSRKIGDCGNGRGEYQNIVDFTVDEQKQRIYILSELPTVIVYSTNGDFIKTVRLSNKSFFRNILKIKDGFIFSTNHLRREEYERESLLYFFDDDFNMTDRKLGVLPKPMFQPPFVRYPLQKDGDTVCYYDNFNTCFHFFSISDISKHKSVALYNDRISTYEDVISERFFKNATDYDEITREYYANGTVYGWGNFFGVYNIFLYDTKRNTLKVSRYTDWNPNIMDYRDCIFYSVISPDVFLNPEMYKSKKTSRLLERLKDSLSKDYSFNSNFCILSFKKK